LPFVIYIFICIYVNAQWHENIDIYISICVYILKTKRGIFILNYFISSRDIFSLHMSAGTREKVLFGALNTLIVAP